MTSPHLTRRTFGGAAILGAAVPVLAACGGGDGDTAAERSDAPSPSDPTSAAQSPSPDESPQAESLVAAADVPVAGGVIVKDAKVVVVQPAEGTFKCFSAVCTHAGCLVGSVEDNVIHCPCHGSAFSAEDGSVVNGPASAPLDEVPVAVDGGQVTRA